jgi:ubiquinone/menaquinone biosynthesis C-methylase UbiE
MDLPGHARTGDYPDYYLRTFHWQTDGWFSEKSAQRYDVSVEFLFGGIANMMRRMTLPPISAMSRERQKSENANEKMKLLEIACGTGSFLQQIRNSYPEAELTGLDLSPDYIRYARKNLNDPSINFVTDNAEHLPFADNSLDAVISINMFHELPPDARRNVFSEVRRVLKPGGIFSVSDSIQAADSDYMHGIMKRFSKRFHEPFYPHYLKDDLAIIFDDYGFNNVVATPYLFSKAIHGTK